MIVFMMVWRSLFVVSVKKARRPVVPLSHSSSRSRSRHPVVRTCSPSTLLNLKHNFEYGPKSIALHRFKRLSVKGAMESPLGASHPDPAAATDQRSSRRVEHCWGKPIHTPHRTGLTAYRLEIVLPGRTEIPSLAEGPHHPKLHSRRQDYAQ